MKKPVARSTIRPISLDAVRGGFVHIIVGALQDAANPWNDGVKAPRDRATGAMSGSEP